MPININIDRSDVISIMALLMSLGAIFVALKQTTILKEQQKIMASQQEGSVWPHLEVKAFIDQDSVSATLKMELKNSGIGPAIITDFMFNESYQDELELATLVDIVKKYEIDLIQNISFNHPFSNGNGNTIPANDKQSIIHLKVGEPKKNYAKLIQLLLEFSNPKFCYESLYKTKYGDDCN